MSGFKKGDRVRWNGGGNLLSGAWVDIGTIGTVLFGPDSDGDYEVRWAGGPRLFVEGRYLTLVEAPTQPGSAVQELARRLTEDDLGMATGIYRDAGRMLLEAIEKDRAARHDP